MVWKINETVYEIEMKWAWKNYEMVLASYEMVLANYEMEMKHSWQINEMVLANYEIDPGKRINISYLYLEFDGIKFKNMTYIWLNLHA